MVNSVNTNYGASIALQTLNATNSALSSTQSRISTGLKVNDARDDSAAWSVAQTMRSQNAALTAVTASLSRGTSTLDVANTAGSAVSDLLTQMQSTVLSASDSSLDDASRASYQQKYQSLANQVKTYLKNAAFNGVNMLDGSTKSISALANADGTSTITAVGQNLSLATNSSGGTAATLTTQTAANGPGVTANVFAISQPTSFTVTTAGNTTGSKNATFTVNLAAGAYTSGTLSTAINNAYTSATGDAASLTDGTTTPGSLVIKTGTVASNVSIGNGTGDFASSLSTFFGSTTSATSGADATAVLANVVTTGGALTQQSAFQLTTDDGSAFSVSMGAGYHTANDIASAINSAYSAAGKQGTAASVSNGKLVLTGVASSTTVSAGSGISAAASGAGDLSTTLKAQQFLGFTNTGGTAAANSGSSNGTAAAAFAETGGGGVIQISGNETFTSHTNYTDLIGKLKASIANVSTALGSLGTASNAMTNHSTFVSKLQDSLTNGVGSLVDADVAKESANLTALQTKQQLGVQALSIANSSSSSLLSLFRG